MGKIEKQDDAALLAHALAYHLQKQGNRLAADIIRAAIPAIPGLTAEALEARMDSAPQPPAEAPAPTLWCMHIHGPDDVHPAPSKHWAELAAKKFNERYAPIAERTGVMAKAVVAEWPHSPESHAESVGAFLFDWIVPAGQAAEAQAQGGGEALEAELIALVAGPYRYHHKMDEHAEREGKAFDRCRELTVQNIRTWCATRRAMLAAQPPSAPVGVEDLVTKWRDRADNIAASDDYNAARKGMYEHCADMLEDALVQHPCKWCNGTGLIDEGDDGTSGVRCYHLAQQPAACETCGGRGWIDDGHEQDDGRMVSAPEDCPECAQQPAAVDGAIRSLPTLWRQREPDNGEDYTEFDKGYEQASDECAEALERGLAQQPPVAPVGVEAMLAEWEKRAGELNDEGLYGCCAGTYEQCVAQLRALAQQPSAAPVGVEAPADEFSGDTPHLIRCIESLLRLDAAGALVPHGVGGHARTMLAAAAKRLAQQPAAVDEAVLHEYIEARDAYEAATRPPNSHAPAPRLKHGDPIVLRYQKARAALAAKPGGDR